MCAYQILSIWRPTFSRSSTWTIENAYDACAHAQHAHTAPSASCVHRLCRTPTVSIWITCAAAAWSFAEPTKTHGAGSMPTRLKALATRQHFP